MVCKLQIRGPSEGKATEGRGQERPAEAPREARDIHVSAKCRATRASQVAIVVDGVPEDLCLAACKGIRLAVSRSCAQNLVKCAKSTCVFVSTEILKHVCAQACCCMVSGTCV